MYIVQSTVLLRDRRTNIEGEGVLCFDVYKSKFGDNSWLSSSTKKVKFSVGFQGQYPFAPMMRSRPF